MLKNFLFLLPCFVYLFSGITLLINRGKNSRPQKIWMVCAFAMAVQTFIASIYYSDLDDFGLYYKLDIIAATLSLMLFPFIHLFFRSLTDEAPLGWKEYMLFLPSLIVGLGSLIPCILMGDAMATEYMEAIIWNLDPWQEFTDPAQRIHFNINVRLYYIVFICQMIWTLIYTVIRMVKYRRRLDDFISDPYEGSLKNIKAVLTGIFILLVTYLLYFVQVSVLGLRSELAPLLMLLYACVIYYINYNVLQVKYTAEDLVASIREVDKEAEELGYVSADTEYDNHAVSKIKKSRRQEIVLRLNMLLDDENIFLKQDLRMDDIVRLTRANRTYVSMLIKEEYGYSFSELINRRRIAYAQRLATDNPNLSHVQIAEESGFTHAASFSRTFKQYIGMTFRQWHKTI